MFANVINIIKLCVNDDIYHIVCYVCLYVHTLMLYLCLLMLMLIPTLILSFANVNIIRRTASSSSRRSARRARPATPRARQSWCVYMYLSLYIIYIYTYIYIYIYSSIQQWCNLGLASLNPNYTTFVSTF